MSWRIHGPISIRSGLLLCLALLAAPWAGAAGGNWIDLERKLQQDADQVYRDAEADLARPANETAELDALFRLSNASDVLGKAVAPEKRERGLALARKLNDADAQCWFLFYDALAKTYADVSGEAAAAIDTARDFADAHALPRCQYQATWIRGYLGYRSGRYPEAMEWYSRAYQLAEKHQDAYRMSWALQSIGSLYGFAWSKPEELEKAVDYLQRALALVDPAVYRKHAAYMYENLGLTYYRLKDHAKARQALELALQGVSGLDAGRMRFRLALVAKDQGHFAEALGYLDKALPLLQQFSEPRFHAQGLIARAEVLQTLGRAKESRDALEEAWTLAQKMNNTVHNVYFHERAAEVYLRLNEYQEAYRQMSLLRSAEKKLSDAANAKQADELKVRFDVQLKEVENARLRAQQKEAEANRLALILALVLSFVLLAGTVYFLRKRAAIAKNEARRNKEVSDAKSAFLANMSHELRSPLNAMLGFTRLLLRDPRLHEPAKHDLGVVLKSGEHLYTLINQVLDMSKIEAGHTTLQEQDFDLYELLDELLETFALTAKQKGLRLAVDSAPDVPAHVCADGVKLRQVLINLLSNAFKFTSEGGVTVRVSALRNGPACRLVFAVTDTGPGIAPDELRELGKAFVQAQAGRQASEGTGLGLAISRNFVQLMGGEFKLSSELGRGTTFEFDIPVRIVAAASVVAGIEQVRRVIGLAPDQPTRRILAVDDRAEGRQLLTRLLTPLGFEVREAANGKEAVEMWEAWAPHLILMDMRMPVMNGMEAARHIRASGKDAGTAIIALTASSFEDQRAEILAAGCDDYVRKPFREDVLLELVRKRLDLAYVYEDAAPQVTAMPNAIDLAALSQELRAPLGHALRQLDVAAIGAALEAIRAQDASLAAALAGLAEGFEYGQMLELLEGNDDTVRKR